MRYKWISCPCNVYSYHQNAIMYNAGGKKQSDSGDLGYGLKIFPILIDGIGIYPAAPGKTCNHCVLHFLHIISPQVLYYGVCF